MRSKKFLTDIQKRAFQKLAILDVAETVDDLRIPSSNYLKSLSGDRKGQWSIRINHKYRICFTLLEHSYLPFVFQVCQSKKC